MPLPSRLSYLHYAVGIANGHVFQEEVTRFPPSDFPSTDLAQYQFCIDDFEAILGLDDTLLFHLQDGFRQTLWLALRKTVIFLLRALNNVTSSDPYMRPVACPLDIPLGYFRLLNMLPPTFPPAEQIISNPFDRAMGLKELIDFIDHWQGTLRKLQVWIIEAQRRIALNPDTAPFHFPHIPSAAWDSVAYYDEERVNDMEIIIRRMDPRCFEYDFYDNSINDSDRPLPHRIFIAGSDESTPTRVLYPDSFDSALNSWDSTTNCSTPYPSPTMSTIGSFVTTMEDEERNDEVKETVNGI